MAGNARFHDKLHRKNHHSIATQGYPDSGTDPIASREEPFQGDFVVNGILSSSAGIDLLSANFSTDLNVGRNARVTGVMRVDDILYINQLSGTSTETIFSDEVVLGNGDNTFTISYKNGVYINSPTTKISNKVDVLSSLTVANYISANNYLLVNNPSESNNTAFSVKQNSNSNNNIASFSSDTKNNCLQITKSAVNIALDLSASENFILNKSLSVIGRTVLNDVLINGSLSTLGDVSVIETSILATSALSVVNHGTETALTIQQFGDVDIANFKSSNTDVAVINNEGITIYGGITSTGIKSNLIVDSHQNLYIANFKKYGEDVVTIDSNGISLISGGLVIDQYGLNTNFITIRYDDIDYVNIGADIGLVVKSSGIIATFNSNGNDVVTIDSNGVNVLSGGLLIDQYADSTIATFKADNTNVVIISSDGITVYGNISATGNIGSNNLNVLGSASSKWDQSYTVLTAGSAKWDQSYTVLTAGSSQWDQSYTVLTAGSAKWDQSYTVLTAGSAKWDQSYTVLTAGSAKWDQSYTVLTAGSSQWDQSYTVLTANSSQWERPKSTYVSLTGVYSNTNITIDLSADSPKFWSVSADSCTIDLNLPSYGTSHVGLIYEVRKGLTGGSDIVNVNNNSVLLQAITYYAKFVYDGSEWFVIEIA